MKKILIILFFSLSVFGSDNLSEGECIALPSSKRYIDFDSSVTYPKTYNFTCDFECRGVDNTVSITSLHHVEVSSLDAEARDVVCYGVKVKRVSWGYDFDRVSKFFAYEAGLIEISQWARDEYISLDHENSKYLMDKLVRDLEIILPSYKMASQSGAVGSKEFGVAVSIIESLLEDLPSNTEGLDQLMIQLESVDLSSHNGLNLVLRVLSSSAKWRRI